MRVDGFPELPPTVMIAVVLMLWPAIWAGALLLVALAGDLRRSRMRTSSPHRTAA